jgi:hypothetical protein
MAACGESGEGEKASETGERHASLRRDRDCCCGGGPSAVAVNSIRTPAALARASSAACCVQTGVWTEPWCWRRGGEARMSGRSAAAKKELRTKASRRASHSTCQGQARPMPVSSWSLIRLLPTRRERNAQAGTGQKNTRDQSSGKQDGLAWPGYCLNGTIAVPGVEYQAELSACWLPSLRVRFLLTSISGGSRISQAQSHSDTVVPSAEPHSHSRQLVSAAASQSHMSVAGSQANEWAAVRAMLVGFHVTQLAAITGCCAPPQPQWSTPTLSCTPLCTYQQHQTTDQRMCGIQ